MMKHVYFLMALLTLLTSHGAHAADPLLTKHSKQFVSGHFLMEACTVVGETAHGMIPHFDCESYIYGVVDSYKTSSQQAACLPKDIAPWQVYQALLALPAPKLEQNAATLIIAALRKNHPCP